MKKLSFVPVIVLSAITALSLSANAAQAHTARFEPMQPVLTAALPAIDTEINWITDKADVLNALREGDRTGAPVMIVFHADWCPWCVRMEKETFTDADVIDLAGKFSCIKVDTDTDWGKAMARAAGVSAYPTTIFYKDGKKVDALIGYRNAADFATGMRDAL